MDWSRPDCWYMPLQSNCLQWPWPSCSSTEHNAAVTLWEQSEAQAEWITCPLQCLTNSLTPDIPGGDLPNKSNWNLCTESDPPGKGPRGRPLNRPPPYCPQWGLNQRHWGTQEMDTNWKLSPETHLKRSDISLAKRICFSMEHKSRKVNDRLAGARFDYTTKDTMTRNCWILPGSEATIPLSCQESDIWHTGMGLHKTALIALYPRQGRRLPETQVQCRTLQRDWSLCRNSSRYVFSLRPIEWTNRTNDITKTLKNTKGAEDRLNSYAVNSNALNRKALPLTPKCRHFLKKGMTGTWKYPLKRSTDVAQSLGWMLTDIKATISIWDAGGTTP